MPTSHKSLTAESVARLASHLILMSDQYPLTFRTERDFFPLIQSFLAGDVPTIKPEVGVEEGVVDFRVGGPNPALLELAVAPRDLSDRNHPAQRFPGHDQGTQLYASQNKQELKKLASIPQAQAKNRYLLLLDLRGKHDVDALKAGYLKMLPLDAGHAPVRVVYARRGPEGITSFQAGGKTRGRRRRSA